MDTKPHPNFSRILGAVQPLAAHARPLSGVWYRCVETPFACDLGRHDQLSAPRLKVID